MTEFVLGTLASITAALIILILARAIAPFSGSLTALFNLFFSLTRLQRAGLYNFITSRSDYRLLKGGESIPKYISGAKHSLVYVGFWHAKGIEMENIKDALSDLLNKGCRVELVLLSDDITDEKVEIVAKYLGISDSSFRTRLTEAWKFVFEMEKGLSRSSGKLIIKKHSEAIYASCFIIDEDFATTKLLVDIRIFGMGRENSFAMELVKTDDSNSLYQRFLKSFTNLRNAAEEIAQ